jgi:hypothetical protein
MSRSSAISIQSLPHQPTPWRCFLILSPSTPWYRVAPRIPCIHITCLPYLPHAPPISFFSILSPKKNWVRSTDHKPALYAVFSIPLLPRSSQFHVSFPAPCSLPPLAYVPPLVTISIFKQKLFAYLSRSESSFTQPPVFYSCVHNLDIYSELSYLSVFTWFGVFYWFPRHGCYSPAREVDRRMTAPTAPSCVPA